MPGYIPSPIDGGFNAERAVDDEQRTYNEKEDRYRFRECLHIHVENDEGHYQDRRRDAVDRAYQVDHVAKPVQSLATYHP